MDMNEYDDYIDQEEHMNGLSRCLQFPKCDPAWASSSANSVFGLPEMTLQPSISSEFELLGSDVAEQEQMQNEVDVSHTPCQGAVMGNCCSKDQRADQVKRARTAKVHNISDRRRRDKIKGKMKVLQELMPHCRKKDRASILEDAANYVKALEIQVQMMIKAREAEFLAQYTPCVGTSTMQFPSMPMSNYIQPAGIGTGAGMTFGAGVYAGCSTPCGQWIHLPPASAGVHPVSPSMLAGFSFPAVYPTAVPPTISRSTNETKPCTNVREQLGTGYIGFC